MGFTEQLSPNFPYFIKDMDDIVFVTESEGPVSVTITCQDSSRSFTVTPIQNQITLHISDLLQSVVPPGGVYQVTVTCAPDSSQASPASIEFYAINGGANVEGGCVNHDLMLTTRSQTSRHYPVFGDPGVSLLAANMAYGSEYCAWTIYPIGAPAVTQEFQPSYRDLHTSKIITLHLPDELLAPYPQGIRAFDLVIGDQMIRSIVMRPDSRVSMFRFRNTFGVYDYIYATGGRKIDFGGAEYKSHIVHKVESEASNNFKKKFITNTGLIGTQSEVDFWADFFRSTKHAVWQNGAFIDIIIDEVSEGEFHVGSIASFNFSWHLAKQSTGRLNNYGLLDTYQYEVPEF